MGRKKEAIKAVCLILAGILVFGTVSPVCASGGKEEKQVLLSAISSKEETRNISDREEKTGDIQDVVKAETVYVKAAADGTPLEIKVSEWLKIMKAGETIEDFSVLEGIENTEGDEEFTRKQDGTIVWENHGENISYEGTTKQELPVSVKVRYYLEEKEVKPEELAGQSGRVRIRFDYENHTLQAVKVKSKEVESVVPFMMCTFLYLPSDVFSNVEVTNGKLMESEEQSIVVGIAFPGLNESLHLKEYEPTKEIEFADFFEITADVTDFELEFTATLATSGLLDELETEDLEDLDEMSENMEELENATKELEDGTQELFDGVKEMKGYMNAYMEGVSAVDEGIGKVKDGVNALKEQNKALKEGADALRDGLNQLETTMNQITLTQSAGAAGTTGTEMNASAGMEGMVLAAETLQKDAEALYSVLEELSDSLKSSAEVVSTARTYQIQVSEKITGIKAQMDALDLSRMNELAKEQAYNVVAEALSESGLDENKIAEIQEKMEEKLAGMDVTAELSRQLFDMENSLMDMPELELPDVTVPTEEISVFIADMQKQLLILKESSGEISSLVQNLAGLSTALESLKGGIHQLNEGSNRLAAGVTAYTEGVVLLSDGVEALKAGSGELAGAGGEFNEGFDALMEGVEALRDGVAEFNREGIKELTDLAGEDLIRVLEAVRASKIRNDAYDNFAGKKDGMRGSVVFLIETEEITRGLH